MCFVELGYGSLHRIGHFYSDVWAVCREIRRCLRNRPMQILGYVHDNIMLVPSCIECAFASCTTVCLEQLYSEHGLLVKRYPPQGLIDITSVSVKLTLNVAQTPACALLSSFRHLLLPIRNPLLRVDCRILKRILDPASISSYRFRVILVCHVDSSSDKANLLRSKIRRRRRQPFVVVHVHVNPAG